MVKRIAFLGLIAFILFSSGLALGGPDMNPGKWEITSETAEMSGMPMQIPPITHMQSVTENDLVPENQ